MKIKSGISLYKFAKKIIPGGTTLFSKRSELHLPNKWPAYFSKEKGTFLWDLKGNKFLDMFCAVGTNVLGYANSTVNKSVSNKINKSNMSTLNCPEEVYLANNTIYVNIFHKKEIIKKYKKVLDKIFFDIGQNKNLKKNLKSKICYKPISRIN